MINLHIIDYKKHKVSDWKSMFMLEFQRCRILVWAYRIHKQKRSHETSSELSKMNGW